MSKPPKALLKPYSKKARKKMRDSQYAIINPSDFADYADPMHESRKFDEDIIRQKMKDARRGKIKEVPSLTIDNDEHGAYIADHDGRHRARALAEMGNDEMLVRIKGSRPKSKTIRQEHTEHYAQSPHVYAEGGRVLESIPQYGMESYYNDPIDPPQFSHGGSLEQEYNMHKFAKGGKAGLLAGIAEEVGSAISQAKKEAELAKAARKAVDKQPTPLTMPRAKPKTQQEIQAVADRVARQQLGEHVTKTGETTNLAGRSKKESQRLQNLAYELERTKSIPESQVAYPKLGEINIALPGDQTIADYRLLSVDGKPIGSEQHGGARYGMGFLDEDNPLFWASGPMPARMFQKKVDRLSQIYNTDEIMAHHLAMGSDSNNYAQHFADANLKAIANSDVSPEGVSAFNDIIRSKFPDFPGIENTDEAYLAMMDNPHMRKFFNGRMKIPKITESLGLPNGQDIQWAITEPELRNMEINLTGHSVGKMKPGVELVPDVEHPTYELGIPGEARGHAPELAPFEISFPDATQYVRATQRPADFTGTIQKIFPAQRVDEQYLDEINQYYEALRRARGFKKGGAVNLEEEYIKEDMLAGGGWESKYNPKKPKRDYNLLPDAEVMKRAAGILGKKAKEEYKTETTDPSLRALSDVALNVGADVLGSPADIANIITSKTPIQSKAKPFGIYEQLKQDDAERIPMFGAKNIRKQLKDTGLVERERPLIEGAVELVLPFGSKIKGAPAGMSIKDVSGGVPFVSTLEKTVNAHKMEAMPGPQWSSWINANAPKGAKKEAEASGLHDWLKTQPKVSKGDIEAFIGENRPQVRVVEKGSPKRLTAEEQQELTDLGSKLTDEWHGGNPLTEDEMNRVMYLSNISEQAKPLNLRHQAEQWEAEARKAQRKGNNLTADVAFRRSEYYNNRADQLELNPIEYGGSKFETYTLPGGKNYQETMLTLPPANIQAEMPAGFEVKEYPTESGGFIFRAETPNTQGTIFNTREQAQQQLDSFASNVAGAKSREKNYYGLRAHSYDDPEADVNRVAHLRTNERPTADNKRALFLEELQSDWAQKGRDVGFVKGLPSLTEQEEKRFQQLLEDGRRNLQGNDLSEFESLLAKRDASAEDRRGIVSGPYVTDTKDWTALGLKHALKKAVDEGHDYLAWTTGEQQADRYDLSKQVGRMQLYKHPEQDLNRLVVNDLEGNEIVNEMLPLEKVHEYVGKEYADKLLNSEPTKYFRSSQSNEPSYIHELSGDGLKIGGEGMKGYYDKIIPQTMNDILKQYGVKDGVKPIGIRLGENADKQISNYQVLDNGMIRLDVDGDQRLFYNKAHADEFLNSFNEASPHMGIEITPELREKILNEGLTHFKRGGKIKPIDLETEYRLTDILTR